MEPPNDQLSTSLAAYLKHSERMLMEQHVQHAADAEKWLAKEKAMESLIERMKIKKQKLTKKLAKLKQEVHRMYALEKSAQQEMSTVPSATSKSSLVFASEQHTQTRRMPRTNLPSFDDSATPLTFDNVHILEEKRKNKTSLPESSTNTAPTAFRLQQKN